MPRYTVLATTLLDIPGDGDGPKLYMAGEVIDFPGRPGWALWPMDDAARAARAAVLAQRIPEQRLHDERRVRWHFRSLPKHQRLALATAEAAFLGAVQ